MNKQSPTITEIFSRMYEMAKRASPQPPKVVYYMPKWVFDSLTEAEKRTLGILPISEGDNDNE